MRKTDRRTTETNSSIKEPENIIDLKTIKGSKPNLPIELKTIQKDNIPLPSTWMVKENENNEFTLNTKLLVMERDNIKILNSNYSFPFIDGLRSALIGKI